MTKQTYTVVWHFTDGRSEKRAKGGFTLEEAKLFIKRELKAKPYAPYYLTYEGEPPCLSTPTSKSS